MAKKKTFDSLLKKSKKSPKFKKAFTKEVKELSLKAQEKKVMARVKQAFKNGVGHAIIIMVKEKDGIACTTKIDGINPIEFALTLSHMIDNIKN